MSGHDIAPPEVGVPELQCNSRQRSPEGLPGWASWHGAVKQGGPCLYLYHPLADISHPKLQRVSLVDQRYGRREFLEGRSGLRSRGLRWQETKIPSGPVRFL